jgi:hypothetical protein
MLEEKDGPMLELLKALDGQRLATPKNPDHAPDADRLAFRFELFQAVSS